MDVCWWKFFSNTSSSTWNAKNIHADFEKSKCYHSFKGLAVIVKEKLIIQESTSDIEKMKLKLANAGNKRVRKSWYAYCTVCQKKFMVLLKHIKTNCQAALK